MEVLTIIKKLIILLFSILISFSSASVLANNELNPPPNTFIVKTVGVLTLITNAKDSKVRTGFVSVFRVDDHLFSEICSSMCFNLFAITSNNIKIDGLDGGLFTEEQSTSGDGRWIESKGVVSLGESDLPIFSIPGYTNKFIGIIKNTFGSAGGKFMLYVIDIKTGKVASTQLDWGENEITSRTKFKMLN